VVFSISMNVQKFMMITGAFLSTPVINSPAAAASSPGAAAATILRPAIVSLETAEARAAASPLQLQHSAGPPRPCPPDILESAERDPAARCLVRLVEFE
jgi:hypothetical protein